MNIYTTLAEIKGAGPCVVGWETLVESLPKGHSEDAPISILHILESNGLDHAEWALRKCPSLEPLNDDYQAKCKAIIDDYRAKCKAIIDDYQAKRKALYDDYRAKLKALLIEIATEASK